MKTVRCAIYTRKSSDEGLEQSFNSLDAQREACAAYILSQASEGWAALPDMYDDGGISGGTLERPALQRMLADIAAGRIDIIVLYKVDRLTRSLLDFSKLVEAFDKASVSFVSVTQSFNTTTSMGRLTLNMLLSFAQFEREVTAERIRDKISASKAKGMWMGGVPPVGYRPDGRSLAIVEEHAAIVRHIYERYLSLGNVRLLERELIRDDIKAPLRTLATGKTIGGLPFFRGQLYTMLKSATYKGEVVHNGQSYVGLHPAIIDADMWERVQQTLASHVRGTRLGKAPAQPSLLAGKVFDEVGDPLWAIHSTKEQRRYRYYVSKALHQKNADQGMRIPAPEIEALVIGRLANLFDDPLDLMAKAWLDVPADQISNHYARCAELAARIRQKQHAAIATLIERVQVERFKVNIDVSTSSLAAALGVSQLDSAPAALTIIAEARLTRSGMAMRLIQSDGRASATKPDRSLIRQVVQARKWWAQLRLGTMTVGELAARDGTTPSWVTRVLRLAFLSPQLVEAVLEGHQVAAADVATLMAKAGLPPSWAAQRVYLPSL